MHDDQATASVELLSDSHAQVIDDMIDHAVDASGPLMTAAVRDRLARRWTRQSKELRGFTREVAARAHLSFPRRMAYTLGSVLCGSMPAFQYVVARVRGHSFHDWAVERLSEVRLVERNMLWLAAIPDWSLLLPAL